MLFSGGALVSARLCRLPEQEVHQPSKKNLPRNPLAESRLPQIARIFTDSLGALISQLIKQIPAACEKQRINRIKRISSLSKEFRLIRLIRCLFCLPQISGMVIRSGGLRPPQHQVGIDYSNHIISL